LFNLIDRHFGLTSISLVLGHLIIASNLIKVFSHSSYAGVPRFAWYSSSSLS